MKSLNFSYLSRLDQLRFWACLIVLFHHFRGNVIVINGDYSWLKNMIKDFLDLTNWDFEEKIQ